MIQRELQVVDTSRDLIEQGQVQDGTRDKAAKEDVCGNKLQESFGVRCDQIVSDDYHKDYLAHKAQDHVQEDVQSFLFSNLKFFLERFDLLFLVDHFLVP